MLSYSHVHLPIGIDLSSFSLLMSEGGCSSVKIGSTVHPHAMRDLFLERMCFLLFSHQSVLSFSCPVNNPSLCQVFKHSILVFFYSWVSDTLGGLTGIITYILYIPASSLMMVAMATCESQMTCYHSRECQLKIHIFPHRFPKLSDDGDIIPLEYILL